MEESFTFGLFRDEGGMDGLITMICHKLYRQLLNGTPLVYCSGLQFAKGDPIMEILIREYAATPDALMPIGFPATENDRLHGSSRWQGSYRDR